MKNEYKILIAVLVVVFVGYLIWRTMRKPDDESYRQGSIDLPYIDQQWRGNVSCTNCDSDCPCDVNQCSSLPSWNGMSGGSCRHFHNKGPQHVVQYPVYE